MTFNSLCSEAYTNVTVGSIWQRLGQRRPLINSSFVFKQSVGNSMSVVFVCVLQIVTEIIDDECKCFLEKLGIPMRKFVKSKLDILFITLPKTIKDGMNFIATDMSWAFTIVTPLFSLTYRTVYFFRYLHICLLSTFMKQNKNNCGASSKCLDSNWVASLSFNTYKIRIRLN